MLINVVVCLPVCLPGQQEVVDEADTLVFVLIDEVESLTAARCAPCCTAAALYRTVSHCTALHCNALHSLPSIVLCCVVLRCLPCTPVVGLRCMLAHAGRCAPSFSLPPWGAAPLPSHPCSHPFTTCHSTQQFNPSCLAAHALAGRRQ